MLNGWNQHAVGESGKIKRMEVYKGDEAVKRYGEKGRNGVVEIRARR